MNMQINSIMFPINAPVKMSGKIYTRICIKDDFIKRDGTSSIYIMIRLNGEKKKLFINLSVTPKGFDKKKGRLKGNSQTAKDYNIVIEKRLSEINKIEVSYRLSGLMLDMDTLLKELTNPTPKYDFIKFWEMEMENQKRMLKAGTYRQQLSSLNKLKKWKKSIAFSSINDEFIKELRLWCKNVQKNKPPTIATMMKNVKKYIHLANKSGIRTPLKFEDIKIKHFSGNRTFLLKDEIQLFYKFWCSEFINESHKNVLSKFLFSCFTSLRISDIQKIENENIVDNTLVYVSEKTGKFNRIKLSASALKFINKGVGPLFNDDYTNEYINRCLKDICIILGVKKHVTFHVARHTFATNFIINGGSVVNLQKILDHSDIKETMIYVHIVNAITDEQIDLMDNILN